MFEYVFYIKEILYMLLLVSAVGYIFVVLKEKLNLRKNTIIIDKKTVTEESLKEADIKVFALGGEQIKSGDELRVVMDGKKKISGIVIGAKKKDNLLLLVTHNNNIRKLKVNKIKKFKIISKYGKFFK